MGKSSTKKTKGHLPTKSKYAMKVARRIAEAKERVRPTSGPGLYMQQFGLGFRLLPGKDLVMIVDHLAMIVDLDQERDK